MQSSQVIDISTVFNKINKLSLPLLIETNDFIDFLLEKKSAILNQTSSKKPIKAGFAKNFFIMKPDFDEPLEDFKDYMP